MHRSLRMLLGLSLAVNVLIAGWALLPQAFTAAQAVDHYFPETHHWVRGQFWTYWQNHGGLAQQGYPLTEEFAEKNALNGQTYTVQYFERAVFEKHPENKPPFDVLLSQLGKFGLDARYPNGSNPAAAPQPGPGGGSPPTSVPAPTQLPAGSGNVDLVQSVNYADSLGNQTFFGVAKNNTGKALQGLDIVLTLLGPNNGTLATGDASEYSDAYIPPGALLPFLVDVRSPPPTWAGVRWQFVPHIFDPSSFTGQRVYKDLAIESATLQPPANSYDDWSLVGTVKNTGSHTAQFVAVHAAVYDAGGKLIDGNYEFTTLDEIPPGGTSPFKMTFGRASTAKLTPVKQDIFIDGEVK